MQTVTHARRLLFIAVLAHFAVTLVHGAAHAAAAVPMSAAATAFILLVIEAGPIAGLLLSRSRPVAAGWIVAATMSGALVFGVINHFVIAGPDHISHITVQWRELFATTAVLLGITEVGGMATGVWCALTRQDAME